MSAAHLIVCERTGRWAAALRQAAGAQRLPLRETRSVPECREALSRSPWSVVAIELTTARLEESLDLLADIGAVFPSATAVAFAERELADHEELARELGAAAFVTSPRDLRPIVRLARRCFSAAPIEEGDIAARVMAQLPWAPTA